MSVVTVPLKEATRAGKRQSERKFVYRDEGNNISGSQLLNQQKRAPDIQFEHISILCKVVNQYPPPK